MNTPTNTNPTNNTNPTHKIVARYLAKLNTVQWEVLVVNKDGVVVNRVAAGIGAIPEEYKEFLVGS